MTVGFRRVAIAVVAALVLTFAATSVASRVAYGTLAWWSDPHRISWCGRQYLPAAGPALTRTAVEQRGSLAGAATYSLVTVTKVPPVVGRPLVAPVTPTAILDRTQSPCATVVYLQTGDDAYRPYVLSGGP
jgi:hypothetical protein